MDGIATRDRPPSPWGTIIRVISARAESLSWIESRNAARERWIKGRSTIPMDIPLRTRTMTMTRGIIALAGHSSGTRRERDLWRLISESATADGGDALTVRWNHWSPKSTLMTLRWEKFIFHFPMIKHFFSSLQFNVLINNCNNGNKNTMIHLPCLIVY